VQHPAASPAGSPGTGPTGRLRTRRPLESEHERVARLRGYLSGNGKNGINGKTARFILPPKPVQGMPKAEMHSGIEPPAEIGSHLGVGRMLDHVIISKLA